MVQVLATAFGSVDEGGVWVDAEACFDTFGLVSYWAFYQHCPILSLKVRFGGHVECNQEVGKDVSSDSE